MIKAVLFDLGDTLIYPAGPWEPVMTRACQALSQTLCEYGVDIPCNDFASEFGTALRRYYAHREQNLEEPTTFILLQDLLSARGLITDNKAIRMALDALYRVTRTNWRPAVDAVDVVRSLRQAGLRLGVLSNAGDDDDVRILVNEAGLELYMDFIVTSAKFGFRKPHSRIFAAVLQHWEYLPPEIVMVGDRLEADIRGAQIAGMHSIWITPDRSALSNDLPQPDFIIETLAQLPSLVNRL
jgi:HAD superfamily hydrolase (TIGR01662 family)